MNFIEVLNKTLHSPVSEAEELTPELQALIKRMQADPAFAAKMNAMAGASKPARETAKPTVGKPTVGKPNIGGSTPPAPAAQAPEAGPSEPSYGPDEEEIQEGDLPALLIKARTSRPHLRRLMSELEKLKQVPTFDLISKDMWDRADPRLVLKLASTGDITSFLEYLGNTTKTNMTVNTGSDLAHELGDEAYGAEGDLLKLSPGSKSLDARGEMTATPGTQKTKKEADPVTLALANTSNVNIWYKLRQEAKEAAQRRIALAPKGSELRKRRLPISDKLFTSDADQEQYAKKKAADMAASPKKYYGDYLYGIFDKTTGQQVYPREGEAGANDPQFRSEMKPQAILLRPVLPRGLREVLPGDRSNYEVKEYVNPKSLTKLRTVKKPLEHGWTQEEVLTAMGYPTAANNYKPRGPLMRLVRKYLPYHVRINTDKSNIEDLNYDLLNAGAIGIIDALRTDTGTAPFAGYAYRPMENEISKDANSGGFSGGDRKKGFGRKGPATGWMVRWTENGIPQQMAFPSEISRYSELSSSDKMKSATGERTPPPTMDPSKSKADAFAAEVQAELTAKGQPADVKVKEYRAKLTTGLETGASLSGGEKDKEVVGRGSTHKIRTPATIAQQRDMIDYLVNRANLTDMQRKVIAMRYGLDMPDTSGTGGAWTGQHGAAGHFGPPDSSVHKKVWTREMETQAKDLQTKIAAATQANQPDEAIRLQQELTKLTQNLGTDPGDPEAQANAVAQTDVLGRRLATHEKGAGKEDPRSGGDIVSVGEIARRLGVSHAAVTKNLRGAFDRIDDFQPPAYKTQGQMHIPYATITPYEREIYDTLKAAKERGEQHPELGGGGLTDQQKVKFQELETRLQNAGEHPESINPRTPRELNPSAQATNRDIAASLRQAYRATQGPYSVGRHAQIPSPEDAEQAFQESFYEVRRMLREDYIRLAISGVLFEDEKLDSKGLLG